jgi:hypothetical protein
MCGAEMCRLPESYLALSQELDLTLPLSALTL